MIIEPKLWKEMARDIRAEPGIIRRRISMPNGVNFFVALISPGGLSAVLVETGNREAMPVLKEGCAGFRISTALVGDDGPTQFTSMILELTDIRYEDIFHTLAEDMAMKMHQAADERQALKDMSLRLNLWRNFFIRQQGGGLGRAEQQGLWGELWAMRNVLFPLVGVSQALQAWVGPEDASQDFSTQNMTFEVKTTATPPHEKFQISNILQLDFKSTGEFILVFLALESRRSNLNTLTMLVDEMRAEIGDASPDLLDLFNTKLILYGYLNAHRDKYADTEYTLRKKRMYRVTDGFPRILEKNLASGVGDVRYSVSISACSDFEIDDETLINMATINEDNQ